MHTSHRDMIRVRLRFLDLIKSFFFEPPDAERLSRWRGTFHALSRTTGATRLDAAIQTLTSRLGTLHLQDLQNEYKNIFAARTGFEPAILSAAKLMGKEASADAEATLTGFLTEAGIETTDTSAIALLDAQMSLINSEKAGHATAHLQARLISEFLVPLFERLLLMLRSNATASFYQDCCAFSLAYLEVEQALYNLSGSHHSWS